MKIKKYIDKSNADELTYNDVKDIYKSLSDELGLPPICFSDFVIENYIIDEKFECDECDEDTFLFKFENKELNIHCESCNKKYSYEEINK